MNNKIYQYFAPCAWCRMETTYTFLELMFRPIPGLIYCISCSERSLTLDQVQDGNRIRINTKKAPDENLSDDY